MKFYKLLYDYENDNDAICCMSDELYSIGQYDVEKGKSIDHWDSRITLYYDPMEGNKETDFLGNDLGWLIVSEKVKKILEEGQIEGIQYLPIKILNKKTNQYLKNYYVVNICNLVDALNLDQSEYDVFELDENEKIISVKLFAVNGNQLKRIDIFKLKDDNIPKFVSERVKKILMKYNVTGFDFLEIKVV
ncbi:MAG: hypothetical protein KAX49_19940 [Halanaerobiales bacterium]|nr:hypothetical protein [Halanaerobiales bacterium]